LAEVQVEVGRGLSMGSGYVVQGNEIVMKELRFPPRE
jgi:hypothetical protein